MALRRTALTAALLAVIGVPYAVRAADCADCDGDGMVSINELITGITIALGGAELSACAAMDRNGDGAVTIAELISAITDALGGCAPTASPSPTPADADTPTPSPTPSATSTAPAAPTASPTSSATSPAPDTPTPTPTADTASQIPPTDAPALRDWLKAARYLGWQAESAPHESTGPHGGIVRVFVNDALFASLSAAAPQHPAGAAAVKEVLYGDTASTVLGWAVMVKIQDDSELGRGWYWYETFGSFTAGGIGIPGCTNCHSAGTDFVRIPFPLQ